MTVNRGVWVVGLWGVGLLSGCALSEGQEEAFLELEDGAELQARTKSPRPFADKNDNGKFDGTDSYLVWSGSTLSSSHSIVVPKYRGGFLYTRDSMSIQSAGNITIAQDIYCKPST